MRYDALVVFDFDAEDRESLWSQNVNMDDWDYAILIEDEGQHGIDRYGRLDDWKMDRMLIGCCSNEWYRVNLWDKKWYMGVAYHA